MSEQWYEVWADESLATPYILLVMADRQADGGVVVLDPKEGFKVIHSSPTYEAARDCLLEVEYTQVMGRMTRGD